MAVLVGRDRTVGLDATVTVIGSASECDVSIPSPHLSRRHALVVRDRKGWLIIDFRSTNGVAVNGTPVEVQRLHEGDVITLSGATGEHEVRFEFRELPGSPPQRRRPGQVSVAEAAARMGALAAAARDQGGLARSALDELIILTGADRAGLVIQDGADNPRVIGSYARRRTTEGPAEDTVSLLPGPASRLRGGEELVFLENCLPDNSTHPRGGHNAMAIQLVRSAVCGALRLRGTLHGLVQVERALFAEPFAPAAADTVDACRAPLALGLAALAQRAAR